MDLAEGITLGLVKNRLNCKFINRVKIEFEKVSLTEYMYKHNLDGIILTTIQPDEYKYVESLQKNGFAHILINRKYTGSDSVCCDHYEGIHRLMEMLILRTISFYSDAAHLVDIHYYATHPQTYYRDGRISYDVPGLARERLEKETGIFQIYFTGCGGNITMGKYNRGTPEDREALACRLYDAMRNSLENTSLEMADGFSWRNKKLFLKLRDEIEFSPKNNLKILSNKQASRL